MSHDVFVPVTAPAFSVTLPVLDVVRLAPAGNTKLVLVKGHATPFATTFNVLLVMLKPKVVENSAICLDRSVAPPGATVPPKLNPPDIAPPVVNSPLTPVTSALVSVTAPVRVLKLDTLPARPLSTYCLVAAPNAVVGSAASIIDPEIVTVVLVILIPQAPVLFQVDRDKTPVLIAEPLATSARSPARLIALNDPELMFGIKATLPFAPAFAENAEVALGALVF